MEGFIAVVIIAATTATVGRVAERIVDHMLSRTTDRSSKRSGGS